MYLEPGPSSSNQSICPCYKRRHLKIVCFGNAVGEMVRGTFRPFTVEAHFREEGRRREGKKESCLRNGCLFTLMYACKPFTEPVFTPRKNPHSGEK